MYITKQLLGDDPKLTIHNEGEWSKTVSPFSAFNDAGVECETGEFLYAFMGILKPQNVLETGTHVGVGASYMGKGLQDNGFGHLDTIEYLPEIHQQAVARIQRLGLGAFVTCHLGDVAKFTPSVKYDFIFLDTEPQTRFSEFDKFYESLNEGGFIFIHDLHRHLHQIPNAEHGFAWPYGTIHESMVELVKTGKIRAFHFPTPRGLTGFYKVSKDDYQFVDFKRIAEDAWKYNDLNK